MSLNLDALLNVLRCPKCRNELLRDADTLVCRNAECRLRFEIKEQIPIMLIEQAVELPLEEWRKLQECV